MISNHHPLRLVAYCRIATTFFPCFSWFVTCLCIVPQLSYMLHATCYMLPISSSIVPHQATLSRPLSRFLSCDHLMAVLAILLESSLALMSWHSHTCSTAGSCMTGLSPSVGSSLPSVAPWPVKTFLMFLFLLFPVSLELCTHVLCSPCAVDVEAKRRIRFGSYFFSASERS